jgi:epoxyqueuosine reductase
MSSLQASAVADCVRALAVAEGFERVGFAAVEPLDVEGGWLDAWLAEGMHAGMGWMATSRDARIEPGRLVPGAATVAVLAMPYAHPTAPEPGGLTGLVSGYARGRDYHNVIGKALRRIQRGLRERYPAMASYGTVDTRPVYERAWAVRAGLGWAGRSCCTILPGLGTQVFLATLLLDVALPPSPALEADCGPCARCLRACPTGALVGPGRLDARRCLSYLTIEHRGAIPEALRPAMGRRVFGCDTCQDTCPQARAARNQGHPAFEPKPDHTWLDLCALLLEDDEALERRLEGSPIRRARAVGLKRNAAVVLGNIGDPAALPALEHAMEHPDPVVREHATWATERCRQG